MNYTNPEQRSIEEWNTYILEILGKQDEKTVLGILPLSKEESEEVIKVVEEFVTGFKNKESLLNIINKRCVVSYAMAYSLSQTDEGDAKKHWKQINEKLKLGAETSWDNERFPDKNYFPKAISGVAKEYHKLTIGKIGQNVPSINFQAGIKRCWTPELKRHLNEISNDLQLPCIDDSRGIKNYASYLAKSAISENQEQSQRLLSMALESELGEMLVRRLIYFESGQKDKLPDFLIEIFEATKEGRKSKSSSQIREPYISYNNDTGRLSLHFPKLKPSTAITASTHWIYKGIPTPVTTCRSRVEEVGFNENIEVSLKGIQGESDRIYKRSTKLNEQSPFRLYRETDGKELVVNYRSSELLPSGDYYVIMSPGVDAGDDQKHCLVYSDDQIMRDDAPIEFSPKYPSLRLKHRDNVFLLKCSDMVSIRLDESQANVISLWQEKLPLVFGSPKIHFNAPNENEFQIKVNVGSEETVISAHEFESDLATYLSELEDKVHVVKVSMTEETASDPVRFLYWNRIKSYDLTKGTIEITNLTELPTPKGYTILGDTLYFDASDLTPYGEITTKRGRCLRLPKSGVVASIREKGKEPQILPLGHTVSVSEEDTRNIMLQVYGQEETVISNQQTGDELITLKPRRKGQRGKGANKKPYSFQYLRENVANQTLLANGEPLAHIQLPHVTSDVVKWYGGKYVFQLPIEGLTEISYKDNSSSRSTLSSKANQWRKGEISLYDGAIKIKGFNPKKGSEFRIEIYLDKTKLPFGRNDLSFDVQDSEGKWKPLQTFENETSFDLHFCFWGSRYDKGRHTHDHIRAEYLKYYQYLQSTPCIKVLEIFPENFYQHNLKEEYMNQSLNHPRTRVDWWKVTAQDLTSLAASDFSLKTYKERDLLPTISPTCLSLSSKYSEASNESLTERALNLNESSQLNEGMAKHQTAYSFDLPSYIEEITPDEERERYFESQVEELLSANHFGYCFSMLEERIASFTEARDESLQSDVLSSYETIIAENNRDYEKLYQKFGYTTFSKDQLWSPYKKPRKRNQVKLDEGALERIEESAEERTLYRVSVLVWWLAFYSRLAAENAFDHNEQSIQQDFVYRVDAVFEKRETLALILTLAPELYAFYTRLFHGTLITE